MTLENVGRALAALTVAFALAAPAAAGTVYAWRTDEGGYAFADDLRRVPEKYRERVEKQESRSLAGHARYTPEDDAATNRYAEELARHLEGQRRHSAALEQSHTAPRAAQGGGQVTVRMGSDGKPVVDIPQAGYAGAEPVVIEDILAKPERGVQTRTNTVIRRGDEIISIVRPLNDTQRPSYRDESDLDRGEY